MWCGQASIGQGTAVVGVSARASMQESMSRWMFGSVYVGSMVFGVLLERFRAVLVVSWQGEGVRLPIDLWRRHGAWPWRGSRPDVSRSSLRTGSTAKNARMIMQIASCMYLDEHGGRTRDFLTGVPL